MKVIQELVAHFDRNKMLSAEQIKSLLEQGFLAADAPDNMVDHCDTVGTTYYFRLTGDEDGMVWGTDVYAGDSSLATAAVHAGAVKVDESTIVKVTVMQPQNHYSGSERNGITSHDFGRFGSAFSVARL